MLFHTFAIIAQDAEKSALQSNTETDTKIENTENKKDAVLRTQTDNRLERKQSLQIGIPNQLLAKPESILPSDPYNYYFVRWQYNISKNFALPIKFIYQRNSENSTAPMIPSLTDFRRSITITDWQENTVKYIFHPAIKYYLFNSSFYVSAGLGRNFGNRQRLDSIYDSQDRSAGILPIATIERNYKAYNFTSASIGFDYTFGNNLQIGCEIQTIKIHKEYYSATYNVRGDDFIGQLSTPVSLQSQLVWFYLQESSFEKADFKNRVPVFLITFGYAF